MAAIHRQLVGRTGRRLRAGVTLAVLAWLAAPAVAQVSPEQAADMVLASARKAYNERQHAFAVTRFREFLSRFGNHRGAPAARYGLALALLEGPQPNYAEARDLLRALAGNQGLPERASALYHLGLALRGLGLDELTLASAKPQEANQRQAAARQRFEEAGRQFAAAAAAFAAQTGEVFPAAKALPLDWEWVARARCDQAEMALRISRAKDAQAATAVFLKDPVLTRSRYRDMGRYYHGFACFLLKDYAGAEATLSMLAPFADPAFGTHARYLLARTHHLADERAEAALHYEAALTDYAKGKKAAVEALRRPEQFQKDPAEKSRLEVLAKDPPPDHVARASFYWGILLYEAGRFADAKARFAEFAKLYAGSPLRGEAQLRLGFCQVQLKEYGEAAKTLQPLVDHERRLADQALLWIGKARAGAAPDPGNRAAHEQALRVAIDLFRQAADRAQQLAGQDPDAKSRRAGILLEMADTMQQAGQAKEAAGVYGQLLADRVLPGREEEIHQRQITALHLAGDYDASDKEVAHFQQKYPQGTLLPEVAFRYAENSYFRALAAEQAPNLADRDREIARLRDETVKRYQAVIDRYPDSPQVSLARYCLGLTFYRKGDLEKAKEALEAVPPSERNGVLGAVPYVMADCLLRLAPTAAPEDALAAGKLEEQLRTAAELLEAFVTSQANSPERPEALLRLGLCQQRLAALLAEPPDKAKALAAARAAYEHFLRPPLARHPYHAQAIFERAKVLAAQGDVNGAVNELRRFTADPLKNSRPAPLAFVQLATLLRAQNRAADAVAILAKGREQYETALAKEAERAGWVSLLRYHHGVALREAGKLDEARAVFDVVVKQSPDRPEAAEAALRWGQCLKEEARRKLAASQKAQGPAAKALQGEGVKALRDAIHYLEAQAEQLKQTQPTSETRARILYEMAWAYRSLAEPEIAAERAKMQEGLAKSAAEGPLAKIPLQPSEKKAREQYRALLAAFPDLPLAGDARFELTELYAQREEHDEAIKLLTEGLDKEPGTELAEKIRLRLGACHAAKGNLKAALAQFGVVTQNAKSPLAAQAHYRAGECLYDARDYAGAVQRLALFRDKTEFQNLPGLTDRALLRLGHAYAQLKDWERSRQAHERVAARFGNSPWGHEARYGVGWAWQQQRQYDQAINAYAQVVAGTPTQTAAKAQLQIGQCRLAQKRFADAGNALLVVPFTYDYPELSAVALLEAARAFQQLKQPDQAERLLRRVLRDHPQSPWAEAARDRLEALKHTAGERGASAP
jgi:TolA-binding protein